MAEDAVLAWNSIALESTKTLPGSQIAPPRQTRLLATVRAALGPAGSLTGQQSWIGQIDPPPLRSGQHSEPACG